MDDWRWSGGGDEGTLGDNDSAKRLRIDVSGDAVDDEQANARWLGCLELLDRENPIPTPTPTPS